MSDNTKVSLGRLIGTTMMGMGLVTIGVMLMLLLNNRSEDPDLPIDSSVIPAEVDYPAPQLDLLTLDGDPVSLADFRGSVVLVNLWATWCPPCRQEMPALQTFYNKYKDQGFVLIAINQEETSEVVKPFIDEYELTFPVWLDEEYLAQREFHTMSLPSSYVIDRNQRVRLLWIGSISARNLEEYVPDIILE